MRDNGGDGCWVVDVAGSSYRAVDDDGLQGNNRSEESPATFAYHSFFEQLLPLVTNTYIFYVLYFLLF